MERDGCMDDSEVEHDMTRSCAIYKEDEDDEASRCATFAFGRKVTEKGPHWNIANHILVGSHTRPGKVERTGCCL
jgi:hypothetical protein